MSPCDGNTSERIFEVVQMLIGIKEQKRGREGEREESSDAENTFCLSPDCRRYF